MRAKVVFALLVAAGVVAGTLVLVQHRPPPAAELQQLDTGSGTNIAAVPPPASPEPVVPKPIALPPIASPGPRTLPESPVPATNKLERLAQIRETFHTLAGGDPVAALRAGKQITDGTERETALLTLVTEWTQGELRPPRERARAIATYGLEAGLGTELAKHPELAVAWADELTDGPGRTAILQQTALSLTSSDPAAAFALSEQLPEDQRRKFFDSVFAGWAGKDTEAALQWADQLSAPEEREAAVQAIRSEAPVGIGTAVGMKDGYPFVQQLLPGTPAELSGQLHPGDRILALAQGDNAFVDAHNLPLSDFVQMIRGAPGTPVQLQIVSADAPPDSPPRTISIIRDQIKFKR
jgi:hypothetical protein